MLGLLAKEVLDIGEHFAVFKLIEFDSEKNLN